MSLLTSAATIKIGFFKQALRALIWLIPIGLAGVGATLFTVNLPAATPRFINDPAELQRLAQDWIQDGTEPVNAIQQLGPRIYQIELGERFPAEENTPKMPHRANPAQISRILAEIHRLDRTLVQFDLPCSSAAKETQTALGNSLDWLNQQFLNLTK